MFVIKCQLSACKNKDQNACGSPLTMEFSVKFVITSHGGIETNHSMKNYFSFRQMISRHFLASKFRIL